MSTLASWWFNKSTVSGGGIAILSNILFLAVKELLGKRVDQHTTVLTVTAATEIDVATKTADIGKDLYVAIATGRIQRVVSNSTIAYTIRLYVNGVVKDEVIISSNGSFNFSLSASSEKVDASQIIKITIQKNSTLTTDNYTADLILWQENDGISPMDDFR